MCCKALAQSTCWSHHRINSKTSRPTKKLVRSTANRPEEPRNDPKKKRNKKTSSAGSRAPATPRGVDRPQIREGWREASQRGRKTCEMRREHVPLPAARRPCCLFPTLLASLLCKVSSLPLLPSLSCTRKQRAFQSAVCSSLAWLFC